MARVTVEDCVTRVPNRFELVLLSVHRARAVAAGEALTVDRDNDKNAVVALREIAVQSVDQDDLRESLLRGMQRHVETDEPEEDEMSLLVTQEQWGEEGPAADNAASAAEATQTEAAAVEGEITVPDPATPDAVETAPDATEGGSDSTEIEAPDVKTTAE